MKFCPHDLFVNTKADLGQCQKLHDDEAKRLYHSSKATSKKIQYEDEFLRFCSNMINEVDRKILKGKQRLTLMNNKTDARPVSKQFDQINIMNDKISKLLREAEDAGLRGDVEQAQGLMSLCDKLKEEKELLVKFHESAGWDVQAEFPTVQEKQMEVCEVCGAFLIVGDAQQRIDDHLTGKQHLGYDRLRKAVEEMHQNRKKEREEDDRRKDEDRKRRDDDIRPSGTSGMNLSQRSRDRRDIICSVRSTYRSFSRSNSSIPYCKKHGRHDRRDIIRGRSSRRSEYIREKLFKV